MPLNKLEKLSISFEKKYKAVMDELYAEIQKGIGDISPSEVADFIHNIFKKHGIDDRTEKVMLDFIVQGAAVGIGAKKIADPVMFRNLWLNKVYDAQGVKFSSRVNSLSRADEMIGIIKDGLRVCKSWNQTTYELLRTGIQKGDVSQAMQKVISNARKIGRIVDDAEFAAQYTKDIRAAQRAIDALANPDVSTLRRAYQRVVDLTEASSKKAIDKAINYAVYFKQKANAERIAVTELSRAYGQARIVEMQNDGDVIGCKSNLNPTHAINDICDFYANADLYGMGAGIYPKGNLPPYPYHPRCMCTLEDVYSGETQEASGKDFDEKGGEKYLKGLTADERKELLGVSGADDFADNPKKWPDLLKNYNEPEAVKGKIPIEVLHGE